MDDLNWAKTFKEQMAELPEEKKRQIAFLVMFKMDYRNKNYQAMKDFLSDKSKNDFDCVNSLDSFDLGAPVHWAVCEGDLKMLKFLHENGANMNLQTQKSKYTPLMIATLNGEKKIISFLLKVGVDRELKDVNGLSAFQMLERSIQSEKADIIRRQEVLKEKIAVQDCFQKVLPQRILNQKVRQKA